jgi:diguanylate cyclase (GGDEF)-like protein
MTLRARIAVMLAVVALGGNALLIYLGSRVVERGFGALEQEQARYRAALAANQIGDETARLSELALDYATEHAMSDYARRPTRQFIENALPGRLLARMRLHLVAVLNPAGRVMFVRVRNGEVFEEEVPQALATHLGDGHPLVTHPSPDHTVAGVLSLRDGPWIVAARPIVARSGAGEILGTFVLGRRMDEELLRDISSAIGLPVRLDAFEGATPAGTGFGVRADSADSMTALAALTDIYDDPAPALGVTVARDIEARRRATQYYLAWSLLFASAGFLITVIALLNRYIAKRMSLLAGFLRYVHASGNLASRLPSGSDDEIGQVTIEINDLLAKIETRNRDLEAARAQALEAMRESDDKNRQLEQANQLIERLARTDPLTKLANRRMFDECLARQISMAGRHGVSFAVIMADLDHFKLMNDEHGHLVGDQLLIQTATVISGHVRAHDVAARYGGEEFVLLMTNTNLTEGMAVAERIRGEVERIEIPGYPRGVTISVGVAQWMPGESATAVLERADEALFRAKRAGRNRVEGNVAMRVASIVRRA